MYSLDFYKARKKKLHLTNDKVAEISGLPKRTVEDFFRGASQDPRTSTLEAIERALGLDQPKPAWTEEDKALGVGDHPVHLSEEEWTWLELRSVLLDVMGKDYLNALIKMLEEIIRKKS